MVIAITVLIATVLGSISGIGGGVIIKPVLDSISGMDAAQTGFLSGCTVLTMSAVSLIRSRKQLHSIGSRGVLLALGGGAGGTLGQKLFAIMFSASGEGALVSLVQNIVMTLLTVAVIFYVLFKEKIAKRDISSPLGTLLIALGLGVFSAFLGIGGGPVNIMVLSFSFSMDTKMAALNSLFIIFFSQLCSLASGSIPTFDERLLLIMIVSALLGATIGRALSTHLDERTIDRLFLGILILIAAISIRNCFAALHAVI